MIAHYYVNYNLHPVVLAKRISEKMTVTVWDRHTKKHEEEVSDNTIIHLFGGQKMTVAELLSKYVNN